MAQHVELPPLRHGLHPAQVVGNAAVGLLLRLRVEIIEVQALVPLREHVDGTDDKVQGRGVFQQLLRVGEVPAGVPQLDAQAQLDPVSHGGPGSVKLRRQGRPVIGPPQVRAGPYDGLHVVGEAQFVQPRLNSGLCQGGHGVPAVGGDAGMHMIISQVHRRVTSFSCPCRRSPSAPRSSRRPWSRRTSAGPLSAPWSSSGAFRCKR